MNKTSCYLKCIKHDIAHSELLKVLLLCCILLELLILPFIVEEFYTNTKYYGNILAGLLLMCLAFIVYNEFIEPYVNHLKEVCHSEE